VIQTTKDANAMTIQKYTDMDISSTLCMGNDGAWPKFKFLLPSKAASSFM
jgi:hypothetical protein